eukprot:6187147-Pleurochrysis_carterae.AAC.1
MFDDARGSSVRDIDVDLCVRRLGQAPPKCLFAEDPGDEAYSRRQDGTHLLTIQGVGNDGIGGDGGCGAHALLQLREQGPARSK